MVELKNRLNPLAATYVVFASLLTSSLRSCPQELRVAVCGRVMLTMMRSSGDNFIVD
jgi:hypothetical protein